MLHNEEIATCEACGKEFTKRIHSIKGRRIRAIRGVKTKTCSKKCSMERVRMVNRIRNRKNKKELKK